MAVGFRSKQFSLRYTTPEICPAGTKEAARKLAERTDQVDGVAGLESGAREFEKKLLKRLLRMRLRPEAGMSDTGCQATPFRLT